MIIRKDKELFIMKFMENNAASRSYMIFQNNFISLPFIRIKKKLGNQNSKKFLSQIFFYPGIAGIHFYHYKNYSHIVTPKIYRFLFTFTHV